MPSLLLPLQPLKDAIIQIVVFYGTTTVALCKGYLDSNKIRHFAVNVYFMDVPIKHSCSRYLQNLILRIFATKFQRAFISNFHFYLSTCIRNT